MPHLSVHWLMGECLELPLMVLAALPGMIKLCGNVNKQTFEKGETILGIHEHGVDEAAPLKV